MGSFPHELPGYRHIAGNAVREQFELAWNVKLNPEPGLRIPNMFDAAIEGTFKGLYVQGEDILQSDPNTKHVVAALSSMECVIVHDLFLNEDRELRPRVPAWFDLPGEGRYVHQRRAPHPARPQGDVSAQTVYADWEVTILLAKAMGFEMKYSHPSAIMDEIAALTPTFTGVSYAKLEDSARYNGPATKRRPRARR